MTNILDIEGIGSKHVENLKKAGVTTVETLLKMGATPEGRKKIENEAGVTHNQVLEWVNRADLYRIKGVGQEFSDLLEAAGVDTVVELSKRVPENLHKKMVEVNGTRKLVRQLPNLAMVQNWVEQAKKLPRVVSY
jgi:predicted flap endonuclease-1-like 5' DNA nuclease